MNNKVVNVLKAGTLRYSVALKLQSSVRDSVVKGTLNDSLIVLEHDPVYTVGIRDKSYTPQEEEKLTALGADFHRTSRGGLITFHGPGQLVVYPIMNLKNYHPSIRWYICSLEDVIIKLCRQFGLHGSRSEHTGVWIKDEKICAFGVHASRYVTTHGLALNCNTDMTWFQHIVPCGIPDKGVTSLTEQLGQKVTPSDVLPTFIKCFESVFNTQCQDMDIEVDDWLRFFQAARILLLLELLFSRF